MSLIDDALKRAQAAGQDPSGAPGQRPWVPAPLPDAGLARRQKALRMAAIALLAGVVAGALTFLATRGSADVARARANARPTLSRSSPAAAEPAPAAAAPSVAVPTPVLASPRPTRVPRPTVAASDQAAAAVAETPAAEPSAQHLTGGRTYVGSIALPGGTKVELGGIVWSETEPRALLNDRIVAAGAYAEGFTVVKIEADRVELEKDGLRIFLAVK